MFDFLTKAQITSGVRWAVTLLAGMVAGWFASKGWFTKEQVMSLLTSESVIAFLVSLVMLGLGQLGRTQSALVKDAAAQPGVVVVAPPAIADKIDSTDVKSSADVAIVSK